MLVHHNTIFVDEPVGVVEVKRDPDIAFVVYQGVCVFVESPGLIEV